MYWTGGAVRSFNSTICPVAFIVDNNGGEDSDWEQFNLKSYKGDESGKDKYDLCSHSIEIAE